MLRKLFVKASSHNSISGAFRLAAISEPLLRSVHNNILAAGFGNVFSVDTVCSFSKTFALGS